MLKVLLCCVLSSVFCIFAEAAEQKPQGRLNTGSAVVPAKGHKGTKPNVVYLPFSLEQVTSAKIDPMYRGVPAAAAISAIANLVQLTKGEFESTADFEQRKQSAIKQKFLGNLTLDDTIPLVVAVQKKESYSNELAYFYDPDKGEVVFSFPSMSTTFNGIGEKDYIYRHDRPIYHHFVLASEFEDRGNYSASNAYGASVTVEKSRSNTFGFATASIDGVGGRFNKALTIPMDAARAGRELPTLKALLVVKPRAPYVLFHLHKLEPTRSSPIDSITSTRSVFGDLIALVLFSGKTGEVLVRLPAPPDDATAETQQP